MRLFPPFLTTSRRLAVAIVFSTTLLGIMNVSLASTTTASATPISDTLVCAGGRTSQTLASGVMAGDTLRISWTGCGQFRVTDSSVLTPLNYDYLRDGTYYPSGRPGPSYVDFSVTATPTAGTPLLTFGGDIAFDYVIVLQGVVTPRPVTQMAPVQMAPTMWTIELNSNGGACSYARTTGSEGSWQPLPKSTDCSKVGSSLLGWSTTVEFPVDLARQQVSKGWGAIDESISGVRMIFIPAGGYTAISGDNTLYAIWG
jgi:hypothetical protein